MEEVHVEEGFWKLLGGFEPVLAASDYDGQADGPAARA
jgi:hypothetical protein